MRVLGGVESEAFHLPRQIGANRLRRIRHPSRDYGFHSYAVLAVVLRKALRGGAKLRLGFLSEWPRRLGQNSLQQVFGGIIPVHFRYSSRQDPGRCYATPV